jgi:hypothetical protein
VSQAIVFACCAVAFLAIYLLLRQRQNPRPPIQWGWLSVIVDDHRDQN